MNEVSKPFYERKVKFILLEDLWDLLEMEDDPLEFMTDMRMSHLIEKLLRDEERGKVARFVQIEISDSPGYNVQVLNCDETIAQFPEWFEEYE
ncbi:MAG: hypothetical protein ACFFDD_04600 [Promethearchaeota archaeon]